jgi:hypothetical protein
MGATQIIQRLVLLGCVILGGCSGVAGGENAGTATAQSERAALLATQIGNSLQVTREAGNQQARATVSARQALSEQTVEWDIRIFDTYDTNSFGWMTGAQTNPELASISWSIDGGKYRWQAKANQGFVWWVTPQSDAYTDFYLKVSAQQNSQPSQGEYGLVFRQTSDDDYYLFEVNGSNEYALYLHSAGGWEALIDWTPHPAVLASEPNLLEVYAQGTYFVFNINSTFVADYSDERLSQGAVGLLVGLSNPGEEATWEFDDFELWAP